MSLTPGDLFPINGFDDPLKDHGLDPVANLVPDNREGPAPGIGTAMQGI